MAGLCSWVVFLAVSPGAPGIESAERVGTVTVPSVDVYDAPDDSAYATARLEEGERLNVVGEPAEGWFAIRPPDGSFDWLDVSALERLSGDRARITAARVALRAGHPNAKLPGPPRRYLKRGTIVRLIDRPPLVLPQRNSARTWRAVAPPDDEVRYVRKRAITLEPNSPNMAIRTPRTSPLRQFDTRFASVGPDAPWGQLDPGFAQALARIEARHREVLREPLVAWNLEAITSDYQGLLDATQDRTGRAILQARLARVSQQQRIAQAARRFSDLAKKSRTLDEAGEIARERLAEAAAPPFDAVGMLQVSSKEVDGKKVFALIGDDGLTSAYLLMPPGLAAYRYVSGQVGVRGNVHYDEPLRARLIEVNELEPLAAAP